MANVGDTRGNRHASLGAATTDKETALLGAAPEKKSTGQTSARDRFTKPTHAKVASPFLPGQSPTLPAADTRKPLVNTGPSPLSGKLALANATRGRTGSSPIESGHLSAAAASAAQALVPQGLKGVDGLGMLDLVDDGRLKLTVPLKPGEYTVGGHTVTVPQGAMLKVDAEVQGGRVVPREGERGTHAKIDPPVEGLAGLITGEGAYVEADGDKKGKIAADIGGWFDRSVTPSMDLGLGSTVRTLAKKDGQQPPSDTSPGLPEGLVQWDQLKFDGAEVKLKDDRVKLGSTELDFGPDTRLKLTGDAKKAELSGRVELDRVAIQQEGLRLEGGPGSANLKVSADRTSDGGYDVKTQLSRLQGHLGEVSADNQKQGNGDHLKLRDVKLRDGQVDLETRLRPDLSIESSRFASRGRVEAKGAEAKLTVPDGQGNADLTVAAENLSSHFDVSDQHIKLQGSASGRFDLQGLQSGSPAAGVDLHHASASGDIDLSVDTSKDVYHAKIKAHDIDVQLDDYRGTDQGVSTDLGRTTLDGSGVLTLDSKRGLAVNGDLSVHGRIDDLKVRAGGKNAETAFDLGKGSTFDGRVRRLSVNDEDGFELDGRVKVKANVEQAKVELPGVGGRGSGRIDGVTDLKIGGGSVSFENAEAKADIDIQSGHLAPTGDKLSAELKEGSKMRLDLKRASYSSAADRVSMEVGAGSTIDAVIDHGKIRAGDYEVNLTKGSSAHMDVHGMKLSSEGTPELHGRLEIHTQGTTNAAGLSDPKRDGLHVETKGATGASTIIVEDVSLTQDGALHMQGVDVELAGQIKELTAISTGQAETAASPAVKTRGKGDAPALPDRADLHLDSPPGVLSPEEAAATTATKLAGVEPPKGALDAVAIARNIKNGAIDLEIPVEGNVPVYVGGFEVGPVKSKGANVGPDFAKGTVLRVQAEIKDGRVIPEKLKAEFSSPGDAAGPGQVQGLMLDQEKQLNVKIGRWPDTTLVDARSKEEKAAGQVNQDGGPRIADLIDGLANLAPQGSAHDEGAFKLGQATIRTRGAELQSGTKLDLPIGKVVTNEASRIKLDWTPSGYELSGTLDSQSLDLGLDALAVKNARGTFDLSVTSKDTAGGDGKTTSKVATKLSNLDLSLDALAYHDQKDYLMIEGLKAKGGTVEVVTTIPTEGASTSTYAVALPDVVGQVRSGRVSVPPDGANRPQVELGATSFTGSVNLKDSGVERLHGEVGQIDAAMRNVELATGQGSLLVEAGRITGNAQIDFTPGKLVATRGKAQVDAIIDEASAQLHRLGLPFDSTVLTDGRTRVRFDVRAFEQLEYDQAPVPGNESQVKTTFKATNATFEGKSRVGDLYGRLLR